MCGVVEECDMILLVEKNTVATFVLEYLSCSSDNMHKHSLCDLKRKLLGL